MFQKNVVKKGFLISLFLKGREIKHRIQAPYRVFGVKPTYCDDYLLSCHSVEWMTELKFAEAYELGEKTGSWYWGKHLSKPVWRTYVICWAASQAKNLEGDFVECGVNLGGYSRAAMHYVDFEKLQKTFYLLDTFCGVPDESLSEQEKQIGVKPYPECYERAKEIFKDYPNAKLIKGIIPATLSQVSSKKIAYLSIDLNCATPEVKAGEFFWDKIVPGGVIILDDYGFTSAVLQRKKWDEFATKKGIKILTLPTGQGLIIK